MSTVDPETHARATQAVLDWYAVSGARPDPELIRDIVHVALSAAGDLPTPEPATAGVVQADTTRALILALADGLHTMADSIATTLEATK